MLDTMFLEQALRFEIFELESNAAGLRFMQKIEIFVSLTVAGARKNFLHCVRRSRVIVRRFRPLRRQRLPPLKRMRGDWYGRRIFFGVGSICHCYFLIST